MDNQTAMMQGMPGGSQSELVIRTLYQIASEYEKGLERQIQRILSLGLERFDLDIGILSTVHNETYTIFKQVSPTDISLNDGDSFPLGDTYCSVTLGANGPVGFEHVAETDLSTHPAYTNFGLEAYIGVPVYVRGKVYGTLNFSSPKPRPRAFSEVDVEALQLMASWVGSELSRRQTEEDLIKAKELLEKQSLEDPLTHLYNRRGVEDKLGRLAMRSRCEGSALMGIVIDVDDFKSINDLYGHSTGDEVLTAIAQVISNSVRPNDICGRVGGDEFIVLLPSCALAEAEIVGEQLRCAVHGLQVASETAEIRPSVSVAVGPLSGDAERVTDALALSASALRSAKTTGKNVVSGWALPDSVG